MTTNNPRCPWEHLSSSLTSAWRESLGARQAVLPETRLSDAERAVQVGDAEGQVQGLTAVEPGIACSLVLVTQVGLGDVLAAPMHSVTSSPVNSMWMRVRDQFAGWRFRHVCHAMRVIQAVA